MQASALINREQVIPLILEACPSFREPFDSCTDQDLLYVVVGALAGHLFDLERSNRTSEFESVSKLIERLHIDGDSYVKELATVGFLESLQNVWSNRGGDPEIFAIWLKPESRKWWRELNDFWEGRIPHVGAGLHNKTRDTDAKK